MPNSENGAGVVRVLEQRARARGLATPGPAPSPRPGPPRQPRGTVQVDAVAGEVVHGPREPGARATGAVRADEPGGPRAAPGAPSSGEVQEPAARGGGEAEVDGRTAHRPQVGEPQPDAARRPDRAPRAARPGRSTRAGPPSGGRVGATSRTSPRGSRSAARVVRDRDAELVDQGLVRRRERAAATASGGDSEGRGADGRAGRAGGGERDEERADQHRASRARRPVTGQRSRRSAQRGFRLEPDRQRVHAVDDGHLPVVDAVASPAPGRGTVGRARGTPSAAPSGPARHPRSGGSRARRRGARSTGRLQVERVHRRRPSRGSRLAPASWQITTSPGEIRWPADLDLASWGSAGRRSARR